jgi:hypothetical protein
MLVLDIQDLGLDFYEAGTIWVQCGDHLVKRRRPNVAEVGWFPQRYAE